MEVIVQDANNIVIEVDQGRQGRGVSSVSLVTVGADYYIQFTFTDGTTQQIGPIATTVTEVISAEVRNAEAVTILKGQPVYLFQAQGNLATVKLAYNTSDATSAKTLGLAAENIAPNAQGLITCQGTLGGLNTSAYSEGDTLYLGATAGTLTNVKPQAPNHLVYIGVVERANAGAGQIYVRVQNGFELDEIHDVQINSPVNGNTLIYDASTSLWKNAGITAGSGISVTNGPASITVGNTGVLSFSGGTTGLTPATATTGAVSLAGTLSTANGGTGLSSFTANRVLYASSTSAIGQSANLTFDGTTLTTNALTVTNNPTFNGGIANGILYLNASKVATSGSSLTFDGTGVERIVATSGAYQIYKDATPSIAARWALNTNFANAAEMSVYNGTSWAHSFTIDSTGYSSWVLSGSEQMRLTSTGLGIGNSAPNTKLDITTTANNGIRLFQTGAANAWNIYTSGNNLRFIEENVGSVMSINAGGNVGIGTTSPTERLEVSGNAAVTGTGYLALQRALIPIGQNGTTQLAFRWYSTGTTYTTGASIQATTEAAWTSTSAPARLEFSTTSSGATTPTIRATLDSSGNLGLGVTPSAWATANGQKALQVGSITALWQGSNGSAGLGFNAYESGSNTYTYITTNPSSLYQHNGSHKWFIAGSGTSGTAISFTQAMTLASTGNLLVGTTTDAGYRLDVSGTSRFTQDVAMATSSGNVGIGTASPTTKLDVAGIDGQGIQFRTASRTVGIGQVSSEAAVYWGSGTALTFSSAAVERARIDSSGNLLVGTTTNTNSSRLTVNGTISETVNSTQYLVASQFDVGTAPNKIPLNQYLGNLAYQNASAIAGQVGFSAGTAALPSIASATDLTTGRWFPAAGVMAWSTGGSERMRLDASGNLGLGVTPSASNLPTIQSAFGILSGNSQANIAANAYYTTQWNYISTAVASLYTQTVGQHRWFNAPSGTAGNAISFTQAMTLDASGNLALGTTTPFTRFDSASARTTALSSIASFNTMPVSVTDTTAFAQGVGGGINFRAQLSVSNYSTYASIWSFRESATTVDYRGSLLFGTAENGLGYPLERMRITSTGNQVLYQPVESAQNTSVTLTVANLQSRIITSNAAVTLTLPTGSNLDTYVGGMAVDSAFECTFIATTANAITIAANGNTTVGSLTVAGNTSGTFRFRKTAANTFTVYRVA